MGKSKVTAAKIVSNDNIAPDHYLMELGSAFLSVNSSPGQFVSVKASDRGTDPLLRIPLGINRINGKGIRLLYKVVGDGTRILSRRGKGEKLDVLGPLGQPFHTGTGGRGKEKKAVLVGGGHGIAPLYALAEELIKKKTKVTVLAGASSKKHIVLAEEFSGMGCEVKIATEDGSLGRKGYVSCLLPEHLGEGKKEDGLPGLYACGPRAMLAAVAREAAKRGMEAQISLDAYMACGIGACLGCAVKTRDGYRMVCKDGPVFGSDEIDWSEEAPEDGAGDRPWT